jgi:hypothetical protein
VSTCEEKRIARLRQLADPRVPLGVDQRLEISNPDLIRDIVDIIETLEEFS